MMRRHRRPIAVTFALIALLLLILGAASCAADKNGHISGIDYLTQPDITQESCPLGLAGPQFELVGIANDGRVLGYYSSLELWDAALTVDGLLSARGWVACAGDEQGIISYTRAGVMPTGAPTYALVVYGAQGGGTSVVVELM
jgi:hypothetical protein